MIRGGRASTRGRPLLEQSTSINHQGARILNCFPSQNREDDWSMDAAFPSDGEAQSVVIPESRDLRQPWWPVRNQGETGACVGFATAEGVLRWHYTTAGLIPPGQQMSPRFIWMANKETDTITDFPTTFIESAGTQTKQALDVARKYGCVLENDLPMEGTLFKGRVQAFYVGASRYRIASYHNLGTDPADWRVWLATQGPILARLNVDATFIAAAATKGKLEAYDDETATGGHAVALVGYGADHFIVRNSWGESWGDRGFAYASVSYAQRAFTEAYGVVLTAPATVPNASVPLTGPAASSLRQPTAASASGGPIVDVHCHVFNAADLPVKGFLKGMGLPDFVAALVDRVFQGAAPEDGSAPTITLDPMAPGDREADETLRRLLAEDPDLRKKYREYLAGDAGEGDTLPGWDQLVTARQYLRWAVLLTKKRRYITDRMRAAFPKVDLFTPLLMDMENWVDDVPKTPLDRQIETMAGIVKEEAGRIHPFMAFDPRREKRDPGGPNGSLALVRRALERGFIGVKVYPPMGYTATGNAEEGIDGALESLYALCESEGVPITTHCSPGGAEAHPGSGKLSNPAFWERVLRRHPRLRLNLGHFGGDREFVEQGRDSWAFKIARLMSDYPHVYADTGHHSVAADTSLRERYLRKLEDLFDELPAVRDRLLYGSDWHMHIRTGEDQGFFDGYVQAYTDRFGPTAGRRFTSDNAVAFLGLGPGGSTRRRLEAYYLREGLTPPAWWNSLPPDPGDPEGGASGGSDSRKPVVVAGGALGAKTLAFGGADAAVLMAPRPQPSVPKPKKGKPATKKPPRPRRSPGS